MLWTPALAAGAVGGRGVRESRGLRCLDEVDGEHGFDHGRDVGNRSGTGEADADSEEHGDCDGTIGRLYERVTGEFPALNVLVNNAGVMRKINLHGAAREMEDLSREIETNLIGPMYMVQQFLLQLKRMEAAAIVNVSSGLAFVPFPISPIYGASKAGLHSYTQSLRVQLKHTRIKVFELAPPSTQTPLQDGFEASDVKGAPIMSVRKLVRRALAGLEANRMEIRPGASNLLRWMSRIAPGLLLKATSGPVDAMLAKGAV